MALSPAIGRPGGQEYDVARAIRTFLEQMAGVACTPSRLPGQGDLRSTIESVLRAALATDLAYAGAYRAWREAILSDRQLASLDARVRAWTTGRLRVVFEMLGKVPGARRGVEVSLFATVMDRLFWELLASPLRSHPRLIDTLVHIIYHSLFDDSSGSASQ